MGAPTGNKFAAKAKTWTAALERAFALPSRIDQKRALDDLAEVLIELAFAGDMAAIKEIGDRLEGRPAQSIDMTVYPDGRAREATDDELLDIATGSGYRAAQAASGPQEPPKLH